jgi:transcriptional regulator with XRE-family HTH domain
MNGRTLLAWNLKRLRGELGMPQERLAADSGVDRAYLSQLERKQGNATVDLLDRLASVLDVPLSELFRQPEPGAKKLKSLPVGRKPIKKHR